MNLFLPFWSMLPFLDLVVTPRFTPTPTPMPASTTGESGFSLEAFLPIVLIFFLIAIGFLIRNALVKKK